VSKWEMVKLGDVATYVNGFAFKPEQWTDKGLSIIRIQNLNNKDALFNYCDESINEKYIVNDGDILISWSASLGVFKWNRGKALLNQHIFKVIFDKIKVEKDFFVFTVGRLLEEMGRQTHGSTMKHITKGNFDNMSFPLPPIETQKQIAKALGTAAELLSMRKQQLAELDNLVKSTFFDMFGDPVANPMGWTVNKMGEVCSKITDGKHGDCNNELGSGYYFISAKDINTGIIQYDKTREIAKVDFEDANKRTRLCAGDLVVVNTGATIGKTALVIDDERTSRTTFQKSVAIIQVIPSKLSNLFLQYYIIIDRDNIYHSASGSAQKNWLLSQMRDYKILVPPIILQNRFTDIALKIEEEKALVKRAIDETQHLFDSLMSQYFD
jgi:type I restriction enzyme, S subunit